MTITGYENAYTDPFDLRLSEPRARADDSTCIYGNSRSIEFRTRCDRRRSVCPERDVPGAPPAAPKPSIIIKTYAVRGRQSNGAVWVFVGNKCRKAKKYRYPSLYRSLTARQVQVFLVRTPKIHPRTAARGRRWSRRSLERTGGWRRATQTQCWADDLPPSRRIVWISG